MSRITDLFNNKKNGILSVYFTAGFPNLDDTAKIVRTLQNEGVDLIEVGIPFSDPLADGPVIQNSGTVALRNGITQAKIFEQLKDIRKDVHIPLIFMGYVNCVMQFGFENFCKKAVEVGIDGIILPDLPLKVYKEEYEPIVKKYNLDFIFLITPATSDERIREIDAASTGFVYMVSSASTTGAQSNFGDAKKAYFQRIESMNLKNPRLIGFGVSNKETFDDACQYASGAIIGSQFIKELQSNPTIEDAVKSLIKRVKG